MSSPNALDLGALDLLPEATVLLDPAGTVVHVNRRAATLVGLDASAVGQPLTSVLDLRDESGAPAVGGLLASVLDRRVADRLAERLLRVQLPDGRLRPLSVAGQRWNDGAVLTFRHAGRRVQGDLARSDLVATVSHEIRSPLTSVKGFTRTLLARWDRFSDEQKQQMLATINEDADRVTRLLTELLDVSRIDTGRVQLQRSPTDLRHLVQRVVDKTRHDDEQPLVRATLPPELPLLQVDPDKIEQVLTNLVENALRHAPGSPVRVAVAERSDAVELVVVDDGPGIPADQLRSIFGKFSRGRGSRRSGTGLGLYITMGLVRAHGGRVWVESVPGQGAAFHVLLPKPGVEELPLHDDSARGLS